MMVIWSRYIGINHLYIQKTCTDYYILRSKQLTDAADAGSLCTEALRITTMKKTVKPAVASSRVRTSGARRVKNSYNAQQPH